MEGLAPAHRHCMHSRWPPTGPLPSTLLLQQWHFPNKLEVAPNLPCRRCVLQQDTAGAATRATEAAQELLRQASRDGQVSTLEGRRLVSCVSSMRLDTLPKGSRDELVAYTAFFAALEVSDLTHHQRLACSCSRQALRKLLSLCSGCSSTLQNFGSCKKHLHARAC